MSMDAVLAANLIVLCILPISWGCGAILAGASPEVAQDQSARVFAVLAACTTVFWVFVLLGGLSA